MNHFVNDDAFAKAAVLLQRQILLTANFSQVRAAPTARINVHEIFLDRALLKSNASVVLDVVHRLAHEFRLISC